MHYLVQSFLFIASIVLIWLFGLGITIFIKDKGYDEGLDLASSFICQDSTNLECKKETKDKLVKFSEEHANSKITK